MNFEELLSKDLSEASVIIRQLSNEEIDQFQAAVLEMNSVFRCHFARLLVFRNDSSRLLSLLDLGDLELCRCCMRYLKIRSVRMDLISKFTSEEEFCRLYNTCCDFGRNAMLETLVWNKKREGECLADKLFLSGKLQMNAYQQNLLLSACSISLFMKHIKENQHLKKYFKLHAKYFEQLALEQLYTLSKETIPSNQEDAFITKCNTYIPFLRNIWTSVTIQNQCIYVYDLLLDLWVKCHQRNECLSQYISVLSNCSVQTLSIDEKKMRHPAKLIRHYNDLLAAFRDIISCIPVYCYTKLEILKKLGEFTAYRFGFESLLFLYQNAQLCGQETIMLEILPYFTAPQNLPSSSSLSSFSDYENAKKILTPEHYQMMIKNLQVAVLTKLQSTSPSSSIYWSWVPNAVGYLSSVVPIEDATQKQILSLFYAFEKQYLDTSNIYDFYGLQNEEVPLDFTYQFASKKMNEYKTCRKWESILCLKGNTLLNAKEASQRMTVLKAIIRLAIRSHDVRSLHRCFTIYARTDMKFNDISMDIDELWDAFSPDSLGLSPLSISMSGSEEEATIARQGFFDMLLEWTNSKKGTVMMHPLAVAVNSMYYFATIYPAYEDVYTDLLKPFCEFLVKEDLQYTYYQLDFMSMIDNRSSFFTTPYCIEKRFSTLSALKEVCDYKVIEECCMKKQAIPSISHIKRMGMPIIFFTCDCPHEGITMTPLVKKPLYMVLSLLSNETTNHEYVGYLFDHFVTSCIITHEDVKTEKEVILRLEDDKKEISRLTMTSTTSGDREVISELLIDDSLQWIKQVKGLSVLDSLNKLTSINSSKFFTPVSVKRTVVQLIDIPEKRMKHKPTLEEKLSNKSYLRRYLIHENPTIISSIIGKNLDTFMQQYNNLLSMTNLEVTLDSLSRLLSLSVPILPLFNILNQHACYADIPILCKTLSNENLKKLQLIATLSTYLTFQAAVTAVSLNRSDKPIMLNAIISQLPNLHNSLVTSCRLLILINNECTYRNISIKSIFTVSTICPFLQKWLESIKEERAQSFYQMKNEEMVVFENAPRLQVELDFSNNAVICRLIEILVYSRTIKEYFGKSVDGLAQLAMMTSTKTALILCRRFVLVSSFVHLTESIIQHLLLTASSKTTVIADIMNMIADSSSCITVALIGMLFRLASKPIMQAQKEAMKEVIAKVTTYIITNDFKSEDVYVCILKWIIKQILTVDDADITFMKELLVKIAHLKIAEDAGKTVFGIIGSIALYKSEDDNCDAIHTTKTASTALKDINQLMKGASTEKVNFIKQTFLEIIPLFDTKEDETYFIHQSSILIDSKYCHCDTELLNYCRSILQEIYKPYDDTCSLFANAVKLLYINECPDALELTNQALIMHNGIFMMKRENKKISTLPDYASLNIPSSMNALVDETSYDFYILSNLIRKDILSLTILSQLQSPLYSDLAIKTYAQCYLNSLEKKDDVTSVKLDALAEAITKSFEPWMYVELKYGSYNMICFDKEDIKKLESMFKATPSVGFAFLIIRTCEDNDYDDEYQAIGGRIKNWIEKEHCTELFTYL